MGGAWSGSSSIGERRCLVSILKGRDTELAHNGCVIGMGKPDRREIIVSNTYIRAIWLFDYLIYRPDRMRRPGDGTKSAEIAGRDEVDADKSELDGPGE